MNKLRILFNSNAPFSPSGYGQQMRELLPLVAKDYPTAQVCFFGLEGGVIDDWQGAKLYPKIADQWGADAMIEHSRNFRADVVISHQDIWTINIELLKKVKNWIAVVPIDHSPTPRAVRDRLNLAYRIVTYSPFGYRQLKEEGYHSTYIPLMVDTTLFKRVDQKKIRKQTNIPDDIFIFGMVAANKDNPPRKSFQQVMDAFVKLRTENKKIGLYIHTLPDQENGFPIKNYAKTIGIEDCLYTPVPYEYLYQIQREDMKTIYSNMDCLLNVSTNEGFGVPIIEAQSCELPVIVNDFSAMPDLIIENKTGFKTRVEYKKYTPLGSYVGVPSVDSIYKQMKKVLLMSNDKRRSMGKKGREFVKTNFDKNLVYKKHWVPFLETLEKELTTKDK